MLNGDIEWVMKQKHVEGRLEVFQIGVRSSILPSTVLRIGLSPIITGGYTSSLLKMEWLASKISNLLK
jgi:hypothetical protein